MAERGPRSVHRGRSRPLSTGARHHAAAVSVEPRTVVAGGALVTTAQKNKPGDTTSSGDREVATNDVRLVGRLSAEPAVVELPSGDALVTFRISVPRASPTRGA